MQGELISLLINPYTGNKLELQDNCLIDPVTAEKARKRIAEAVVSPDTLQG